MSNYLHFTKPDGSKVRILKGTIIEFNLWVGAANAEQTIKGLANEITEKAQIVINDTLQLKVGDSVMNVEDFYGDNRTRVGLMLFSVCMTQVSKHCEEY